MSPRACLYVCVCVCDLFSAKTWLTFLQLFLNVGCARYYIYIYVFFCRSPKSTIINLKVLRKLCCIWWSAYMHQNSSVKWSHLNSTHSTHIFIRNFSELIFISHSLHYFRQMGWTMHDYVCISFNMSYCNFFFVMSTREIWYEEKK